MTPTLAFTIISGLVTMLPQLIDAGIDISSRIMHIKTLSDAGANGTLTDAMIQEARNQLDGDLTLFNADLPPEGGSMVG